MAKIEITEKQEYLGEQKGLLLSGFFEHVLGISLNFFPLREVDQHTADHAQHPAEGALNTLKPLQVGLFCGQIGFYFCEVFT